MTFKFLYVIKTYFKVLLLTLINLMIPFAPGGRYIEINAILES
jgi:hypothetical protein